MAKKFLDSDGLNTLWTQICSIFPSKDGTGATGAWGMVGYGTCSTAAATAEKVVTITDTS